MCYIFVTVYKIRLISETGVNPVFPVHHLDFINYCPDIHFFSQNVKAEVSSNYIKSLKDFIWKIKKLMEGGPNNYNQLVVYRRRDFYQRR